MDTGRGEFAKISEEKADELFEKNVEGLFRLGEIIKVKGSLFKVHNINKFGLKLRILPKE